MQESQDTELLRQFVRENSDEAFAALVSRHLNLVYSAALRKTGSPVAAEEVTQAVFVILARKANGLLQHTALSGWLYQAARLTAANFLRTEIRRARREQEAYMQSLANQTEPEIWPQIMPLLEDAMGRLGEKDRNALALRFFEGKSFQEIGTAFGVSENAARKRTNHALEKLRTYFSQSGVTSTTETIAEAISARSVQAAPVALAKSVTAVAIVKGSIAAASTLTLVKGTIKVMTYAKLRAAIVVTTVMLLAGGAVTVALSDSGAPTSSFANSRPNPTAELAGQTNAPMVAIDSQFVFIPDDSVEKLGIKWQPEESGGTMSVLDKSQSSAVMQSLEHTAGVEFLRDNGGGPTSGKTVKNGGRLTTSGKLVRVSVTKSVAGAGTIANIAMDLYLTPFCSSDSSSFELNLTNELHEAQTRISRASVTLESGQTIVLRQAVVASQSPDKNITTSSSLLVFVTPTHFKAGTGLHRLN